MAEPPFRSQPSASEAGASPVNAADASSSDAPLYDLIIRNSRPLDLSQAQPGNISCDDRPPLADIAIRDRQIIAQEIPCSPNFPFAPPAFWPVFWLKETHSEYSKALA